MQRCERIKDDAFLLRGTVWHACWWKAMVCDRSSSGIVVHFQASAHTNHQTATHRR